MKIAMFGMGYVGVVGAACLLRDGHSVVGVDPSAAKLDAIAGGHSPIHEPGVAQMLADGHRAGRLSATADPAVAIDGTDMAWICVGTPSRADGSLNFDALDAVAAQIGEALRRTAVRPLIVVRSTSLPGTTRTRFIPTIERAGGLKVGGDVHVVFHPEFLREGCAVADFDDPPKIVVGEAHAGAADPLLRLYERYPGPRFRLTLEEAETVKYWDNAFHAVKITFANEMGALARAAGVDARRVSEVFCADTKLNISPRYLKPGFAFGGSCLPKDLRATLREAAIRSIRVPMIEGTLASNAVQIEGLLARILACKPRRIGMVGLAFKPDTDDMRESPYVTVAKRLIGEGLALRIYDPGVRPAELIGRNRELVQAALGHLEALLVESPDAFADCDVILVNHPTVDAARVLAWTAADKRVIDLASVAAVPRDTPNYEGICW